MITLVRNSNGGVGLTVGSVLKIISLIAGLFAGGGYMVAETSHEHMSAERLQGIMNKLADNRDEIAQLQEDLRSLRRENRERYAQLAQMLELITKQHKE